MVFMGPQPSIGPIIAGLLRNVTQDSTRVTLCGAIRRVVRLLRVEAGLGPRGSSANGRLLEFLQLHVARGMNAGGQTVLHKLQSMARARGTTTDHLLKRWASERFLARLSDSPYRDRLTLKGGNLFALWTGDLHRGTWDIDLQAGEADLAGMREILVEVLVRDVDPVDGILFDPGDVGFVDLVGSRIPGLRMHAWGRLGTARISLKIDVGFGHPVSPGVEVGWFPALLPQLPAFPLSTCPRETMIAEKLAVMVEFGRDNTRLRDYYDIWFLSRNHAFSGRRLLDALGETFALRDAGALLQRTDGYWEASLGQDFVTSRLERSWKTWLQERAPASDPPSLVQVVEQVARFGLPLLIALQQNRALDRLWRPATGWQPLYVQKQPPAHGPERLDKLRRRCGRTNLAGCRPPHITPRLDGPARELGEALQSGRQEAPIGGVVRCKGAGQQALSKQRVPGNVP